MGAAREDVRAPRDDTDVGIAGARDAERKEQGSESAWTAYFDDLPENLEQFEAEADDFVHRLERQVPLRSTMRVLDFGCGLGITAARIAERVRTIAIWDESASMRRRAVDRVSRVGRAELLDLSAGAPTGVEPFDLILVHSVVQYVTEPELRKLMALWAAALETSGVVILSDVVPERSTIVHDIAHTVGFSVRRGVMFTAVPAMLREFTRYAALRRRAPLLRLSGARVAAMAAAAGLECRALDANLGFRRNRLSFVLSRRSTLR